MTSGVRPKQIPLQSGSFSTLIVVLTAATVPHQLHAESVLRTDNCEKRAKTSRLLSEVRANREKGSPHLPLVDREDARKAIARVCFPGGLLPEIAGLGIPHCAFGSQ